MLKTSSINGTPWLPAYDDTEDDVKNMISHAVYILPIFHITPTLMNTDFRWDCLPAVRLIIKIEIARHYGVSYFRCKRCTRRHCQKGCSMMGLCSWRNQSLFSRRHPFFWDERKRFSFLMAVCQELSQDFARK